MWSPSIGEIELKVRLTYLARQWVALVFFTVHTSKQAHTAKHRLAWHLIFHYFQSFFLSLDSTVLLQHCKLRPRNVLVVSHFFENSPIMYWCKTRTQVSTEIWIPWLFSKVGCCIDSSRTSPEVVASTPILWHLDAYFVTLRFVSWISSGTSSVKPVDSIPPIWLHLSPRLAMFPLKFLKWFDFPCDSTFVVPVCGLNPVDPPAYGSGTILYHDLCRTSNTCFVSSRACKPSSAGIFRPLSFPWKTIIT